MHPFVLVAAMAVLFHRRKENIVAEEEEDTAAPALQNEGDVLDSISSRNSASSTNECHSSRGPPLCSEDSEMR
jgi:hypothetical protein